MKMLMLLLLTGTGFLAAAQNKEGRKEPLFNGSSFAGWNGDTLKTWRIRDGAIVGGSLSENVPRNEFLATNQPHQNFILQLQFKLLGTEGFINGGIQFNSKRIENPPNEMTGYQADLGKGYWGCLYDESRRNKVIAFADSMVVRQVLKLNEWNDYEVRSEKGRIRIYINGKQTVDYTEPDQSIPQSGLIALQVHGGGKVEVSYKNIFITKLD